MGPSDMRWQVSKCKFQWGLYLLNVKTHFSCYTVSWWKTFHKDAWLLWSESTHIWPESCRHWWASGYQDLDWGRWCEKVKTGLQAVSVRVRSRTEATLFQVWRKLEVHTTIGRATGASQRGHHKPFHLQHQVEGSTELSPEYVMNLRPLEKPPPPPHLSPYFQHSQWLSESSSESCFKPHICSGSGCSCLQRIKPLFFFYFLDLS